MRVAWDGSILGVSWAEALAAVAALLTPFAILFLTGLVHRRSQRLEEQQRQEQERLEADRWRSQELVKARLDRYNKLAGPLNSIFCYFTFIGRWKELSPVEILDLKREADQTFYVAMPLFTAEVKDSYESFIGLCFRHFGPWGQPATLRTSFCLRQRHYSGRWDEQWAGMFDRDVRQGVSAHELIAIREAHNRFLRVLAIDVGVDPQQMSQVTARVENNEHDCSD